VEIRVTMTNTAGTWEAASTKTPKLKKHFNKRATNDDPEPITETTPEDLRLATLRDVAAVVDRPIQEVSATWDATIGEIVINTDPPVTY